MAKLLGTLLIAAALCTPSAALANNHQWFAPVPTAGAQGTFKVKFEQVANNCKNTGMTLGKADVRIDKGKGSSISVTVPMVPIMKGSSGKGGKFKAKAKKGKTGIAGVDGRFRIQGRVNGNAIQFLFIAEYFKGDAPLCTQSWNGNGQR
jgi:hypothetical protein